MICPRGHSFDVARSGYINLLQPQERRSRNPGDSADAVAATGYAALMRGRSVVVPGVVNHAATLACRLLPRGLLAKAVTRLQRGAPNPSTGS